jgi:hypothetical protein
VLFPNKYFGKWENEPEQSAQLDIDRNYDLFAILADVRNGYGFAGAETGDGFKYIAKDRGFPDDISKEVRDTACTGDHTPTWVSLKEILEFDWNQKTNKRGMIKPNVFAKWDRRKEYNPQPEGWCYGVGGNGIVILQEEEMREYVNKIIGEAYGNIPEKKEKDRRLVDENEWPSPITRYCEVRWQCKYAKSTKNMWEQILPHMLPLGKKHGYDNVRLVMNFDS